MASSMKIKKEDLQDLYPLTRMQEGMLFHALREPDSPAYTEQVVWRIDGSLNVDRYREAWDRVHARYEALRSVFTHEKTRQALQLVLKERKADLSWTDLQALPSDEQQRHLLAARQAERERPFDLGAGPLLRISGHQLAPASCEICVTWHHILLDGWSTHRMFQDVLSIYRALAAGAVPQLPPLPAYAPYVEWLQRQDESASLAWWKEQLHGYEGIAAIPKPSAPPTGSGLRKLDFQLDAATLQTLQELAGQRQATVSSVLRTVWGLVLGHYCDSGDVVFGAVLSGRTPEVPGIEELPGLLINTVPVRVRFATGDSFAELLARVHRQALDAQSHQTCRLADIQNTTEQRSDLIQHLLVFENYPVQPHPATDPGALRLEVVETSEPTHYDLLVVVDPSREGLRIEFQYRAEVYDEELVHQVAGHFRRLLLASLQAPDSRLSELDPFDAEERQYLIHGVNATARDYPRDSTLAQVFAAMVATHGQRPAVVHAGGSLSYTELDQRANRLAYFMEQRGVRPGQRVLLLLERSPELIEAILAIAKLGASYLPFDPESPQERLRFALTDASVVAAVLPAATNRDLGGLPCIHPDADATAIAACPAHPPAPHTGSEEVCVFYTSGSTGIPKGVRIPRRGVLRLVCNADYLPLGPSDRIAHVAHVAFDAINFEIWGALLNGASLHIVGRDTALTPSALARAIREQGLTTLFLTTALFNQMARETPDAFAPLGTLLTGGERADEQWMQRVLEHGRPGRLLHVYGPTEVTTFATYEPVEGVVPGVPVPIGKPIGNTLAYVVDRELRLQPPYAAGELLLGGDGIALGYLERPQLNAERFIPAPFRGGGTLYRTGDIVRRLPDGRLEFIGRRDQQIKLRGFRIELGEIEAALRDFPQCEQALVVLHEEAGSEQRRLVAYLAMPSAPAHADLALRRHLKQRLPDYMIPSAFVILERMPLNANGKIDRKALPAPVRGGTGFGKAFVAPVGALEQQLADIWARVLGVAQIGRNDNFFELGGHSLSASTAIGQIRAALRVDMPLPLFFQCPSLQALAEEVQRLQASAPPPSSGIARVARTAVQPPSGDV